MIIQKDIFNHKIINQVKIYKDRTNIRGNWHRENRTRLTGNNIAKYFRLQTIATNANYFKTGYFTKILKKCPFSTLNSF